MALCGIRKSLHKLECECVSSYNYSCFCVGAT